MNLGVIIQARTGSSRLPDKMIMPLAEGQSILEIIINKLKNHFPLVLATTVESNDDELMELAATLNVPCYRGSENNVLERFIEAAEEYNLDVIVRVCADNPFINVELLNNMIDLYDGEDYCSFRYDNGKPTILGHLGLFAEIVSLNALKKVQQLTSEKLYIEHVTNYVYSHPELFDICLHDLPAEIQNYEGIRLTVDTQQDFDAVSELYSKCKDKNSLSDIQSMLDEIKSNSVLLLGMEKEILKNSK